MRIHTAAKLRRVAVAGGALAGAATLLAGCNFGGAVTASVHGHASYPADRSSGVYQQVKRDYPGATKITMNWATNNPNFVTWVMPDGKRCAALTDQVYTAGISAHEMIAQPFCDVG